jgi:predicted RNA-binding protein with PIN domain
VTAVLIDARNVLRSEWPNIPEQKLVELCRAWARREGCRAVIVFDREAPGGLVGERELDPDCLLVGTGEEIADDWIARAAEEYGAAGAPYWLVTSDRGLREAAGPHAEKTIGGGSFARELRALA